MSRSANGPPQPWPPLPYEAWGESCATLQLWLQIVGKVRLALTPWVNHSWHATLYPTACGLTTGPIPYEADVFQLDFDFLDHRLRIARSDGRSGMLELRPRTVADFYRALMDELATLGIEVRIHGAPNEVPDAIPFARDERHGAYDAQYTQRFWRVVSNAARVFEDFRGEFIGKCSPVHLFWGASDLAVTRFSGRRAPPHPGGVPNLPDRVTREAYSHEVCSAGFWPGADTYPEAIFYTYAYPEPEGFRQARIAPAAARWDEDLSEFVLPYDAVRESPSPEATLRAFLASAYEAAAECGGWDRAALEWGPGARPGIGWREETEGS